jgi:hypothetical protein
MKQTHKHFLVLLFAFMLTTQLTAQISCTLPIEQETPPIGRFDFTIWSSPVDNFLIKDVSPDTLIDKFFTLNTTTQAWESVDPNTTTMVPGKGYFIRGPSDYFPYRPTLEIYKAKFTYGTPNNTDIPVAIAGGAKMNALGNPYCQTIGADCFIREAANQNVTDGTIYFWTHNIPIDWTGGTTNPINPNVDYTTVYNYNSASFAVYNLMGGIGTGNTLSTTNAQISSNRPNGLISKCQGFLVRGKNGGTSYFKTNMVENITAQFFKNNDTNAVPPPGSCEVLDRHRIWLQIKKGSFYKEALIGYSNEATNGPNLDYGFDGLLAPPSSPAPIVNLYSLLSSTALDKLTIQSRKNQAVFDTNDVITLGFSCPAGPVEISNAGYDGLFGNQNFWLRENNGGIINYHDIKTSPYLFTAATAFTDNTTRFQIVFKLPTAASSISSYCGMVAPSVDHTIYSAPYVSGVTYHYLVTCPTDPTFVRELNAGNSLNLSNLAAGVLFGTTYTIQAANYQIDGVWIYGSYICNITTPANPPTKNLNTCSGLVLTKFDNTIFANNSPIYGLTPTGYRYRVTDITGAPFSNTPSIIEKSNAGGFPYPYGFSLNDLTRPICAPNQTPHASGTYRVEISIQYRGNWGDFGSACTITTSATATKMVAIKDFNAVVYPNPFSNNFKLDVVSSSNDIVEAVVYDMIGRQIERFKLSASEINSLEIGNKYPTGIYNIVVKQRDNSETLRIIKK